MRKDAVRIEIIESALKHGLSRDEIVYALENSRKSRTVKRSGNVDKEVEFVLGVLPNGNFCELAVALSYDEQALLVFHAQTPPTKGFLRQIDGSL